jgi:hypothetical protein
MSRPTTVGTGAAQNLLRYTAALVDTNSSNYSTFGARLYNPVTAFFTTRSGTRQIREMRL